MFFVFFFFNSATIKLFVVVVYSRLGSRNAGFPLDSKENNRSCSRGMSIEILCILVVTAVSESDCNLFCTFYTISNETTGVNDFFFFSQ